MRTRVAGLAVLLVVYVLSGYATIPVVITNTVNDGYYDTRF